MKSKLEWVAVLAVCAVAAFLGWKVYTYQGKLETAQKALAASERVVQSQKRALAVKATVITIEKTVEAGHTKALGRIQREQAVSAKQVSVALSKAPVWADTPVPHEVQEVINAR